MAIVASKIAKRFYDFEGVSGTNMIHIVSSDNLGMTDGDVLFDATPGSVWSVTYDVNVTLLTVAGASATLSVERKVFCTLTKSAVPAYSTAVSPLFVNQSLSGGIASALTLQTQRDTGVSGMLVRVGMLNSDFPAGGTIGPSAFVDNQINILVQQTTATPTKNRVFLDIKAYGQQLA